MNKINNKLLTIGMAFLMLFVIGSMYNVSANSADGQGGTPTDPGRGSFFMIEGRAETTQAWGEFLTRHARGLSSPSYIQRVIDYYEPSGGGYFKSGGNYNKGFKKPDGTYEKLSTSCKRSEYIWYYAHDSYTPWTSSQGYTYNYADWFSAGGNTNNAPFRNNTLNGNAGFLFNEYKASSRSRWNSGRVVIVCSGALNAELPDKQDLQLTADSKRVEYDGKPHTVNTERITNGNLKKGHKLSTKTNTTKTNEGIYTVKVKGVVITDSKGNNVTSKYKLSTKPGKLTIYANPDKSLIKKDDEHQCIDTRLEPKAEGPIWVDLVVNPFFQVENNSLESQTVAGINTQLGDYVDKGEFEKLKDITDWNEWVNKFTNIKSGNDRTPTLTLSDKNQSGLSRYGGVLTGTRRYKNKSFQVETCQPQTREWEEDKIIRKDENGNDYLYKDNSDFGEWKDDGVRLIENRKSSDPKKGKDYHYQIISANCNKEEFDKAVNASNLSVNVTSLGDRTGSAIGTTAITDNVNALPFGKPSHSEPALRRTGQKGFYTDGTSCDVFSCTSNIIKEAKNNSVENTGENPLFKEVVDENDKDNDGKPKVNPSGKDYLVFFRDNKDRSVRADIWQPNNFDNGELLIDKNRTISNTYAKIMPGGTPEIDITTIAPGTSSNNRIEKVNKTKRWSGEVNVFNIKSQWASEKDKPYELGVSWEFTAKAKNKIPVDINGDGIKSFKKANGEENVFTYNFPIACEFRNDKNSSNKAIISTSPYASGQLPKEKNPNAITDAIRTLFTRAVSDVSE